MLHPVCVYPWVTAFDWPYRVGACEQGGKIFKRILGEIRSKCSELVCVIKKQLFHFFWLLSLWAFLMTPSFHLLAAQSLQSSVMESVPLPPENVILGDLDSASPNLITDPDFAMGPTFLYLCPYPLNIQLAPTARRIHNIRGLLNLSLRSPLRLRQPLSLRTSTSVTNAVVFIAVK